MPRPIQTGNPRATRHDDDVITTHSAIYSAMNPYARARDRQPHCAFSPAAAAPAASQCQDDQPRRRKRPRLGRRRDRMFNTWEIDRQLLAGGYRKLRLSTHKDQLGSNGILNMRRTVRRCAVIGEYARQARVGRAVKRPPRHHGRNKSRRRRFKRSIHHRQKVSKRSRRPDNRSQRNHRPDVAANVHSSLLGPRTSHRPPRLAQGVK